MTGTTNSVPDITLGISVGLSPTGVPSLLPRCGNLDMDPGFGISLLSPGVCPTLDKSEGTLGALLGVASAKFSLP